MAKRPLHLSTPREVRASLAKLTNEIRNGDITPQVGNACVGACNVILSALRTDEQDRRIGAVEQALSELEGSDDGSA